MKGPEWWLAGFLFVGLLVFAWIFDFNGLYGQDAHEYHRYAKEIDAFLSGGDRPGPFFWPLGYPYLGALLGKLLGSPNAGLQILSMASQSSLVIGICAITCSLFHNTNRLQTAIFAFLFVGLSPFMVRNGILVMSDSVATAACVFAVLGCIQYYQHPRAKALIFAALMAGLAGAVRFNSAVILLIPALMAGFQLLRTRRFTDLIFPALVLGLSLMPELLWHERPVDAFTAGDLSGQFSLRNLFSAQFDSDQGNLQYAFPNIIFLLKPLMHPGFLFLGGVFTVVTLWKRKTIQAGAYNWILVTVVFYLLFLGLLPIQSDRLFVQIFPLIAVVLFPGFVFLANKLKQQKVMGGIAVVGVLIIQVGLSYYSTRKVRSINRTEIELVKWVNDFPDQKVYTFGVETAFSSYGVKPAFESMWYAPVQNAQKGELVLFNLPAFETQFQDYMPMQNWHYFEQNFTLKPLKNHPQGWTLYELR